jgi:MFS family permease
MRRELWTIREFVAFLVAMTIERFAASSLTVMLGFQVYTLRNEPLDLALLGLVEVIPGIGLVLVGGDAADRRSRRRMILGTTVALALLGAVLSAASAVGTGLLPVLLGAAFLSAALRAFMNPALVGLEAQILPRHLIFEGIPILSLSARVADMTGPVLIGFLWAASGPVVSYAVLGGLFAVATLIFLLFIAEKPVASLGDGGSPLQRITEGVRYVFGNQPLVGSMALDLFAVFFGGAAALLPIFATDILQVGPAGFGILRAAGAAGGLTAGVLATRLMPKRHAGLALHGVIAGFGVAMIVFGLSENFYLSLAALFVAGACDGFSVTIRHAIMRLASPEHLRGRIAAVRMVFVGSSNELGAVESGLAASWLGPARAVWAGGLFTLGVVACVAWRMPELRRLNLLTYGQTPPAAKLAPVEA